MQSTFFTDFLYLTDIKTILFIVVLFALFFVMKQMEKKKLNFQRVCYLQLESDWS